MEIKVNDEVLYKKHSKFGCVVPNIYLHGVVKALFVCDESNESVALMKTDDGLAYIPTSWIYKVVKR